MDINLIKKLIKIVEQSEITEFSIQEGELKLKISKSVNHPAQVHLQPISEPAKLYTGIHTHPLQNIESNSIAVTSDQSQQKYHEIKSPIVGTFYRSPSPEADPYIQVGSIVSEGTVLCIVEAMKLMNEIESDISGKIVKILVENATPVEYNQLLFLIETV